MIHFSQFRNLEFFMCEKWKFHWIFYLVRKKHQLKHNCSHIEIIISYKFKAHIKIYITCHTVKKCHEIEPGDDSELLLLTRAKSHWRKKKCGAWHSQMLFSVGNFAYMEALINYLQQRIVINIFFVFPCVQSCWFVESMEHARKIYIIKKKHQVAADSSDLFNAI